MDYNIDEYKIKNNNIYIKGWVHDNNYKIIVISNGESKTISKYESRYDICMSFHEPIEENNYGFVEELVFKKKIKIAHIFVKKDSELFEIKKIDNRKIINNVSKAYRKVGRGVKFLWREYHFIVPPYMIKKYVKDAFFNKKKKATLFNPNIDSDYKKWLSINNYKDDDVDNEISDLTFIHEIDELKKIKTKYVCIINDQIELNNNFYFEINKVLENDYDLIYYDNDRIIDNKYVKPLFKPGWSRDTLLGVNYIGNCFIIKKKVLSSMKLSNLNPYTILLNMIDNTSNVYHINKILYHDGSMEKSGYNEVNDYLKKSKIDVIIKRNIDKITNTVIYKVKDKKLISIIIPTKDHVDILKKCIDSIYDKSSYKNFEIIVIDNNSVEKETFEYLNKCKKKYKNFRVKRIESEFNFSYLNNEGVKISKGDYILMLNNDIEVISNDFLETMLGYSMQSHVGTVGVKLLFPDNTIQHAGIIMGKGGLAGHAHYERPRDYAGYGYELKVPYNYSACTAACLMVSKEKYLEVNGLDENLKVAFNDVDFNLKLLEKGYYNVFLPNIELYHYESKSRGLDTTKEKQKRFVQEWSYIVDKWSKYIEHDEFYNDNFSKNNEYMLK